MTVENRHCYQRKDVVHSVQHGGCLQGVEPVHHGLPVGRIAGLRCDPVDRCRSNGGPKHDFHDLLGIEAEALDPVHRNQLQDFQSKRLQLGVRNELVQICEDFLE